MTSDKCYKSPVECWRQGADDDDDYGDKLAAIISHIVRRTRCDVRRHVQETRNGDEVATPGE